MRVAYFLDTAPSVNWGCQATSAGIRRLVLEKYPNAEFVPLSFGKLPKLRWIMDRLLLLIIRRDKASWLSCLLRFYGVQPIDYSSFDAVFFNGEGSIHDRSGHVFRLLGLLYAFKQHGVPVYVVNQSVDVSLSGRAATLIRLVYPKLDLISAREPVSLRQLQTMGVYARILPDAAYAAERLSTVEIDIRRVKYNLPHDFIAVTASSAFSKNRAAVAATERLLTVLKRMERPLVFLANTKTDFYLARHLAASFQLHIISYEDADYRDAIAIISRASLLVGGRQHPNIFAAKYGVPFVALDGNTHKMNGVVELLNYPVPVFAWDFNDAVLEDTVRRVLSHHIDFSGVSVPVVSYLDLS